MVKRITILLVLGILSQNILIAGSFKKYAGEFAYLGAGPRGTAMGGAFTALSNDVTSTYWNPAGLMEAKGLQALFMHSKQFISSIQNNYLAVSSPYDENSAIGFSVYYLTVIDIPNSINAKDGELENKVNYSKVNFFNTGDYIFTASYSRIFNEQLNWGINVKLIYRDYELESATGLGFDLGIKYKLDNLKLGAVVRDVTGTLMTWSTNTTEFITPSLRLGAAYTYLLTDFNLEIIPALDINILNENRDYSAQYNISSLSSDILTGLEITYDNIISLRAGMDDLQRFTTGIGFSLPRVNIDYSFTAYENELGDIHRISLHTFFGDVFYK